MPKRRVKTLLQRLMHPSLCSLSSRLTKKREIKAMPILFFTASLTDAALLHTQSTFSGSPFLANTFFKSRSVALPLSLPTKTSPAISSSAAVRPSSGCPDQKTADTQKNPAAPFPELSPDRGCCLKFSPLRFVYCLFRR